MDILLIIAVINVKKIMQEPFIMQQYLSFMIIKCYYVIQMQLGIISPIGNVFMVKMMSAFYLIIQSNSGENIKITENYL